MGVYTLHPNGPAKLWAAELIFKSTLRGGLSSASGKVMISKSEEHIRRFEPPRGRYYKWIQSGEIQEYVILDFRTSQPQKIRPNTPFLYFVVFSKDYTRYKIYDAALNLVEEERALTT
jgi:hypothetical protein